MFCFSHVFIHCPIGFFFFQTTGYQSAHWAPSCNLVVALESGVYVCKINEDCNVVEIRSNTLEPENPFCHVIWNADGKHGQSSTL